MSESIRYITASEVHAALAYPQLVEALRSAFVAGAEAPVRSSFSVTPEGDRLLLMPAWRPGIDMGVKLVTVFPRNREKGVPSVSALYVLLDGATGHPRVLIDGEALTLRRTAAASALASTFLSRPESACLLVVGTGALAPYMAAAHCAVRSIRTVLVWGRSRDRAQLTVRALTAAGIPAEPIDDLSGGLSRADIVSCATTSREPLVHGTLIRPGTHVDLVGAFTRDMREADDALVAKADVFVDTFAGALKEAGDLVQPIEKGVISKDHIRAELADLVTGRHSGRQDEAQVTVFKSVGTALEDLCAAKLVFERIRLPGISGP